MMEIQDKSLEIMNKFYLFAHGVRILMLIDRGIMNSNKGSKRWINKIITTNDTEFREALNKLLDLQYHLNNPDIRLYSCVNSRDINKSIKLFNHKQLDVSEDQILKFYSKINNTFCSALMAPENKEEKYFLLDCDKVDVSEISDFTIQNDIYVFLTYLTKKGWHLVTKSFDVRLLEKLPDVTLQKDGLLLLNWIKETE